MTKVSDIVCFLDKKYPPYLASNFDSGKIGLQFGTFHHDVKKVMIALDGTTEVIQEMIDKKVDLLITHHPFMFNSLLSMQYDNQLMKKIKLVIQNECNVYAMHTNFDVSSNGMNEILAKILELKEIHSEKPEIDASTFLRIGKLEKPQMFSEFVEMVKEKLEEDAVRIVSSNPSKKVEIVGIIGGSGGFELQSAYQNHCDVFITGEIKHNIAIDALDLGVNLIEVSHGVERLFRKSLMQLLSVQFPNVQFILSEKDKNPFQWVK